MELRNGVDVALGVDAGLRLRPVAHHPTAIHLHSGQSPQPGPWRTSGSDSPAWRCSVMTKAGEQTAPARPRTRTTWDAYCPEENLAVFMMCETEEDADRAAREHNMQFTPPHTAGAAIHTPSDEDPPHLTAAQREAFVRNQSDFAELEQHSRSVREAAEARLRHASYDPNGPLYCYRCTCGSFLSSGENSRVCGRSFCRHTAMEHA
jgi:hypothetical protein